MNSFWWRILQRHTDLREIIAKCWNYNGRYYYQNSLNLKIEVCLQQINFQNKFIFQWQRLCSCCFFFLFLYVIENGTHHSLKPIFQTTKKCILCWTKDVTLEAMFLSFFVFRRRFLLLLLFLSKIVGVWCALHTFIGKIWRVNECDCGNVSEFWC